MQLQRFIVHVYKVDFNHEEFSFDNSGTAIIYCSTRFKNESDVYKIKLWDTALGEIEPNNPKEKALVQTWV